MEKTDCRTSPSLGRHHHPRPPTACPGVAASPYVQATHVKCEVVVKCRVVGRRDEHSLARLSQHVENRVEDRRTAALHGRQRASHGRAELQCGDTLHWGVGKEGRSCRAAVGRGPSTPGLAGWVEQGCDGAGTLPRLLVAQRAHLHDGAAQHSCKRVAQPRRAVHGCRVAHRLCRDRRAAQQALLHSSTARGLDVDVGGGGGAEGG
eukprot:362027-Chlamydomonas_euryale.AAC.1